MANMDNRVICQLVLLVWVALAVAEDTDKVRPLIELKQGQILGDVWHSRSGREFGAFTTIPYAEPPLGVLRFQPPRDPKPWEGVRDIQDHPMVQCAQIDMRENIYGEEDCLHVNVYSPIVIDNQPKNEKKTLPVMVWLHGGGFFSGSATTNIYGPEYFMDQDVIIVTLNYRLGVLGFFSLENEGAPGNIGLRDQIKALEWVQKNIEHFGGDPNQVTIFGESAGSMCVLYLVISPLAKDLFHGAIAISGSILSSFTGHDKQPKAYAKLLARELNCDNKEEDLEKMLYCLQELPVLDLPGKMRDFLHIDWTGPNVFKPSLDGNLDGRGKYLPVLPNDPIECLKNGEYNKVPLIMGTNKDEGIFNMIPFLRGILTFDEFERRWDELGPLILFHRALDEITPKDMELARKVKRFYLGDSGKICEDNLLKFAEMYGDSMFFGSVTETARLFASTNPHPTYQYIFSYDGTFTTIDAFTMKPWQYGLKLALKYYLNLDVWDRDLGVAHADMLFLLFQPHALPWPSLFTEEDQLVSQRLISMMADFARTGNPTPASHLWTPVTASSHEYLNITSAPTMSMEFDEDHRKRADFWTVILDEEADRRGHISDRDPLLFHELKVNEGRVLHTEL